MHVLHRPSGPNPNLPESLQEVCAILALGILRLRSRIAAESANTPAEARARGDIRLHSTARQRVHANPKRKGVA
jgi:hypothetical protein